MFSEGAKWHFLRMKIGVNRRVSMQYGRADNDARPPAISTDSNIALDTQDRRHARNWSTKAPP